MVMLSDLTRLNEGLMNYINGSPSPFHAVANTETMLKQAGYQELKESEMWHIQPQKGYYVIRNGSSIIAFKLGDKPLVSTGFRMVGAHTDSPCLHVKPIGELSRFGYHQLATATYGSALLNTWFDRDLSLAGRVVFVQEDKLQSKLINFKRAIATIPNLAIHLNREANKGHAINPQTEVIPILSSAEQNTPFDLKQWLSQQLLQEHHIKDAHILDYELSFYDTQPGQIVGLEKDFITSARLDNLLSCFAGLTALLESKNDENCLLVLTDHEEVGSCSACGADGPFLEQVLIRLLPNTQELIRCIQNSLLISTDNAHALHPNYPQKHDDNHMPKINGGPVIKINSNQRYATNSITSSFFRNLCLKQQIPVQTFVTRNDIACGSTIGPITASKLGINTVDIGAPTFAMHSIREMAGSKDLVYMTRALMAFYDASMLID